MEEVIIAGHTVPATALTETFDTTGGPGGQHSNRNETAVRLKLSVSAAGFDQSIESKLITAFGESIEVLSADSRSQFRNRALARQRLKQKVEAALVNKPARRPTRPTRASQHRRVESKKARGETKRLRRKPDVSD